MTEKIEALKQKCIKWVHYTGRLTPVLYDLYSPSYTGFVFGRFIFYGSGYAEVLIYFDGYGYCTMDIELLKYRVKGHNDWLTFDEVMRLP